MQRIAVLGDRDRLHDSPGVGQAVGGRLHLAVGVGIAEALVSEPFSHHADSETLDAVVESLLCSRSPKGAWDWRGSLPSGPAITVRNVARSVMLRAIGPRWSMVHSIG